MPILHTQLSGQAKTPQGQLVQVPPAVALLRQGPCVQVSIGLAQSIANQLLQQGKSLPKPVSGVALIDTGATSTCIDDGAAAQLQLPVVNVVNVASASHASTLQNVYPIQIEVVGLPISNKLPRRKRRGIELKTLFITQQAAGNYTRSD